MLTTRVYLNSKVFPYELGYKLGTLEKEKKKPHASFLLLLLKLLNQIGRGTAWGSASSIRASGDS